VQSQSVAPTPLSDCSAGGARGALKKTVILHCGISRPFARFAASSKNKKPAPAFAGAG